MGIGYGRPRHPDAGAYEGALRAALPGALPVHRRPPGLGPGRTAAHGLRGLLLVLVAAASRVDGDGWRRTASSGSCLATGRGCACPPPRCTGRSSVWLGRCGPAPRHDRHDLGDDLGQTGGPTDMNSPAKRRTVRLLRLLQAWPLWYVGTAVLGLLGCLAGWMAGRTEWLRYGLWLGVPLVLLTGNILFVLAIAAVLNFGVWVWEAHVGRRRMDFIGEIVREPGPPGPLGPVGQCLNPPARAPRHGSIDGSPEPLCGILPCKAQGSSLRGERVRPSSLRFVPT